MQRTLVLILVASGSVFAQPETHIVSGGLGGGAGFQSISASTVQNAPYSATITNESVQSLADGNRIVQSSSGTTARDSMGRTRQDLPLPSIGNMAPADTPRLVLLQDPVAQVSYTLNLTDKTARKGSSFSMMNFAGTAASVTTASGAMIARTVAGPVITAQLAPLPLSIQRTTIADEGEVRAEDLGSKTMEGVSVTGTRTTRTIPAGQIGNDKPLSIVTEVWTSPELKTVVSSKRSDPRMGDQTFQLTNIVRAEPDPTLFTVPSDFMTLDAAGPVVYKDAGVPAPDR